MNADDSGHQNIENAIYYQSSYPALKPSAKKHDFSEIFIH